MTGDQDGIPWQEIVTIENPVGYELSVQNECWLYFQICVPQAFFTNTGPTAEN